MFNYEHEQIAALSEHAAAVFSDGQQFEIVFLSDCPDAERTRQVMDGRGFVFCGTIGFHDGQALVKSESVPQAAGVMARVALEFAERVVTRIRRRQGDAVIWLERLYALADPRSEAPPKV